MEEAGKTFRELDQVYKQENQQEVSSPNGPPLLKKVSMLSVSDFSSLPFIWSHYIYANTLEMNGGFK